MKKIKSLFVLFLMILSLSVVDKNILNAFCLDDATWDSRNYGWVTDVKKQEDGICWAYSMCSAAETDVLAQGLETDIDFSEGYMFAVHNLSTQDKNSETATSDSPDLILKTGQNYNLLAYESDYPYSAYSTLTSKDIEINPCKYRIASSGRLSQGEVKDWIKKHGSVICGLYFPQSNENEFVYTDEFLETNHVVTIVGWNDNIPAYKFENQPDNDGAWLVKNSWGEDAGDNGYFWVSYEDASISTYFGITVEKCEPYNCIGSCGLAGFDCVTLSVTSRNNDFFGMCRAYKVAPGDVLNGFNIIANEKTQYVYKLYWVESVKPSRFVDQTNLIASGIIDSKFTEYSYTTKAVDYTVQKPGYILLVVMTPVTDELLIGAELEERENTNDTYYIFSKDNNLVIGERSEYVLRASLFKNQSAAPINQNQTIEHTKQEDTVQIQTQTQTEQNTQAESTPTPTNSNSSLVRNIVIAIIIISAFVIQFFRKLRKPSV